MKKYIIATLCIVVLCALFLTSSALSEARADSRIHTFGQKNYTKDSQTIGSRTFNLYCGKDHLSANGCCTFTYAHAIQWMTGINASSNGAYYQLLEELLNRTRTPWNDGNSVYSSYIKSVYGAVSVTPTKTQTWMNSHFSKYGVIIGHLNWQAQAGQKNGGGHYFLIIGGTTHNNTYYLHVLDSNCSSTIRRVQCYDFSSFNTLPTDTANGVLDYWIPMNKFDTTYRTYNGWSAKIYFDGAFYSNMRAPTTLEFRNVDYPSNYNTGSNGFDLKGGVIVSNAELTSINAWIEDSQGAKISKMSSAFLIFGRCYPIRDLDGRKSDMGQKFSYIKSSGTYYWVLNVTDNLGRSLTMRMTIHAVTSGSTIKGTESLSYDTYQTQDKKVSSIELEDQGGYDITNCTVTYYDYDTVGNAYYVQGWVSPSDASNSSLNWSSSNTNVLRYDSSENLGDGGTLAKFTIRGRGVSTITATSRDGSNVSSSFTFELKAPTSTSISLPSTTVVQTGYRKKITASLDTGGTISWTSSDSWTVRVSDDGYIYGCKPGIAYITATAEDNSSVSATCMVTVEAPTSIEKFYPGCQNSKAISGDYRSEILSFTPTITGYYVFESRYDEHDTYGYVYDNSWQLLAYNDDGGDNNHFRIRYCFLEGQTYYLFARMYNPFTDDVLTVGLERDDTIQTLDLISNKEAVIEDYGAVAYFSFTPSSAGNYAFSSNTKDQDTFIYLYDAYWNLINYDDDSGEGFNFALNVYLNGGETYYLGTRFYSQSLVGSFYVSAQNYVPVQSLSHADEYYTLDYLWLNSSFSLPPVVYPENATNKGIIYPVYNDGVISVSSDGTIQTIGCGISSFTVYSKDNPDISLDYVVAVYEWTEEGNPDWYVTNVQAANDGKINFDIATSGRATCNAFSLFIPDYNVTKVIPRTGYRFTSTVYGDDPAFRSTYIYIHTEDEYQHMELGTDLVHIELSPISEPYWGKVQEIELSCGLLLGYPSIQGYEGGLCIGYTGLRKIAISFPEMPKTFTTPSVLQIIDEEVFSGLRSDYIILSEKVATIKNKAFANCGKLKCIYIPASCTSISTNAFYGDSGIIIYGNSGSYAETFASTNGITFRPVYTLAERIKQHIMSDADYKAYDAKLDLNGDGNISSADYTLARKAE